MSEYHNIICILIALFVGIPYLLVIFHVAGVIYMKLFCRIGLHLWNLMDFNKGRWCSCCGKVQSSPDCGEHWEDYGTVEVKDGRPVPGTWKKKKEQSK